MEKMGVEIDRKENGRTWSELAKTSLDRKKWESLVCGLYLDRNEGNEDDCSVGLGFHQDATSPSPPFSSQINHQDDMYRIREKMTCMERLCHIQVYHYNLT